MLNKGVTPFVCQKGSVGACGDLAPMSQIALLMMGEGKAYYKGELLEGKEAMSKAGIPIPGLQARDGLAAINGSNVLTAMSAIFLYDAMMSRTAYHNEGTTSGGLVLPNYFNLTNSVSPATTIDELFKKKINSLYGSASFAWKSMVYLDLTLRNDWSSTLPTNKNSYLYPSVTGSWVFTEMPTLRNNSIISFGKVRAGWAQVGNDTDPYRLMTLWTNYDNFGSDIRYSRPAQLNNPDLKPEKTTSYEVGTELKFFNNRIGIDFSYYDKTSKNEIIPVTISGASGYTTKVINAGELSNKGYEIMLNLVPIKMKDFVWNMAFQSEEVISPDMVFIFLSTFR